MRAGPFGAVHTSTGYEAAFYGKRSEVAGMWAVGSTSWHGRPSTALADW